MSLERRGSLAIGRKEAGMEESDLPFFSLGVMVVDFQAEGKAPFDKEKLNMKAIKGERRSERFLRSETGSGSEAEHLLGSRWMALEMEWGRLE